MTIVVSNMTLIGLYDATLFWRRKSINQSSLHFNLGEFPGEKIQQIYANIISLFRAPQI